jgi:hypothetical protein
VATGEHKEEGVLQKRSAQEMGADGRAYALSAAVTLPSTFGMKRYGTWPQVQDQLTPLYNDMREGKTLVSEYAERTTAIVGRDLVPTKQTRLSPRLGGAQGSTCRPPIRRHR